MTPGENEYIETGETGRMEGQEELRPSGAGVYRFTIQTPWGQQIPAEMLLATRSGWARRPEASDPRWTAYPVGPAVLAIRLLGGLPKARTPPDPSLMLGLARRVSNAEWN